jgi:hypothetical protein
MSTRTTSGELMALALCLTLAVANHRSVAQDASRMTINRNGTQVTLSWNGVSQRQYQLYSTTRLGDPWQVVATEPAALVANSNRLSYVVSLGPVTHFYRVAELAEPPPAGCWLSLVSPTGTGLVAGQPVRIEVRASHDEPLASIAFRLAASRPEGSSAAAVLNNRSAAPGQQNGLAFISAQSMRPFQSGLPADLAASSREVLLNVLPPPRDAIVPGPNLLVETLELTPTGNGTLTLSILDVQAVAADWAFPGGWLFTEVGPHQAQGTLTFEVRGGVAGAAVVGLGPTGNTDQRQPLEANLAPAEGGATPLGAQAQVFPDVDQSGAVNEVDLVFVRARLGRATLPENAGADANRDERIDLLDLVAVRNRLEWSQDLPLAEGLRLNEVSPDRGDGQPAWVEIACRGSMSGRVELRGLGGEPISVNGWLLFQKGQWIRVIFDGDDLPQVTTNSGRSVIEYHGKPIPALLGIQKGGCVLRAETARDEWVEVDRVAWGDVAETRGQLNTSALPAPPAGTFGRDPVDSERWIRCATPTPGAPNSLGAITPRFPPPGAILPAADSETVFAWIDLSERRTSYRLQVAADASFAAPAIDAVFAETVARLSPGLTQGKCYWRVRAEAGQQVTPWSDAISFDVESKRLALAKAGLTGMPGNDKAIFWFLINPLPDCRKDTAMVCLECSQDPSHPWDGPHRASLACNHDALSDLGAAVAGINHYYGGNITVDEVAWLGSQPNNPLSLGHGSRDQLTAFAAVMGGVDLEIMHCCEDGWDDVTMMIDRGIPCLLFGGMGEPHLIYGYEDTAGVKRLRVINPLVNVRYMVEASAWKSEIVFAPNAAPSSAVKARKTDPRIAKDSDGDGLCDFDEIERFQTNPMEMDTDQDGIDDKTEVWSYLFGTGRIPRKPDTDGDGRRAELDDDSDGDGCIDGKEDVNGNGMLGETVLGSLWKEPGERDPFSVEKFKLEHRAARTSIAFGESLSIEWTLEEIHGTKREPVGDAELELSIEPISSLADFEGDPGPIVVTTGEDGKASVNVRAKKEEGVFVVEALHRGCGVQTWTRLPIKVEPYDWIFAVQEETVLNGPSEELYFPPSAPIRPGSLAVSGSTKLDVWNPGGRQTARGYFFDPKTLTPGKYIRSIGLVGKLAPRDKNTITLRIDDQEIASSFWQRSTPEDSPVRWEIEIDVENYTFFPRFLRLTLVDGTIRLTPLLWWSRCGSHREIYRSVHSLAPRTPTGSPTRTLALERTVQFAYFFFGDGDQSGKDTSSEWPGNPHTAVSYIPRATVAGLSEGEAKKDGQYLPEHWTADGSSAPDASGEWRHYVVFGPADGKGTVYVERVPWTLTNGSYSGSHDRFYPDTSQAIKSELESLGRPKVPPFLEGIEYERDYIGDDLKKIQERNIEAPRYTIKMKLGIP